MNDDDCCSERLRVKAARPKRVVAVNAERTATEATNICDGGKLAVGQASAKNGGEETNCSKLKDVLRQSGTNNDD